MPKRTYAEFAAESETNLVVLTADGGRIPAHAEVRILAAAWNFIQTHQRANDAGTR